MRAQCHRSISKLAIIAKYLVKIFEVRDSVTKDTREIDQIRLRLC